MLPPVVCFQCGRPLLWSQYRQLCHTTASPAEALRVMALKDCCRMHLLAAADPASVVFEPLGTECYGEVDTGRTSASFITPQ